MAGRLISLGRVGTKGRRMPGIGDRERLESRVRDRATDEFRSRDAKTVPWLAPHRACDHGPGGRVGGAVGKPVEPAACLRPAPHDQTASLGRVVQSERGEIPGHPPRVLLGLPPQGAPVMQHGVHALAVLEGEDVGRKGSRSEADKELLPVRRQRRAECGLERGPVALPPRPVPACRLLEAMSSALLLLPCQA